MRAIRSMDSTLYRIQGLVHPTIHTGVRGTRKTASKYEATCVCVSKCSAPGPQREHIRLGQGGPVLPQDFGGQVATVPLALRLGDGLQLAGDSQVTQLVHAAPAHDVGGLASKAAGASEGGVERMIRT